MRKFLILLIIPMFLAAVACSKGEESAPSGGGAEASASEAASPAAEASPAASAAASPAP